MSVSTSEGDESDSSISDIASDAEWEFEKVTGERKRQGRIEYRIKFVDSWVNKKDLNKWYPQVDTILEATKKKHLVRWKANLWERASNVPSRHLADWREEKRRRKQQQDAGRRSREVTNTQSSKTSTQQQGTQQSSWPSPSPTPCETENNDTASALEEIPDTFESEPWDTHSDKSDAIFHGASHFAWELEVAEEARSQQRRERATTLKSPRYPSTHCLTGEFIPNSLEEHSEAWGTVAAKATKVTCQASHESRLWTPPGEAGQPEPLHLQATPANEQTLQQQAREALAAFPGYQDARESSVIPTTEESRPHAIDEGEIPSHQPQSHDNSLSDTAWQTRLRGIDSQERSAHHHTFSNTVLNRVGHCGSSGTPSRSASPEFSTMASSGQEDPEAQGPIAPWGNDTTLQGEAQAHSEPQLLPEHFNATMATSPTMSTVTPAEVSTLGVQSSTTLPLLPGHSMPSSGSQALPSNSIPLGQVPLSLSTTSQAISHKPSATNYHIITIPFHNSTRALYFATMRSHMSTFEKFNTTYSAEDYSTPDEQLQSEIEEALTDLVYTCDYGGESLEIMPDTDIEKQMRHVVEKVSKVQFLHELLPALGPINVLIVVGSDNLTRLMIHLISRIHKLPWSCPENPAAQCDPRLFTDALHAPRITIATSRHAESGDFDLVIAYDRSFDGSAMASNTAAASATQSTPTVLRLVTTLSVEHLELAIAGESGSDQGPMENLEKTMRLVWALVHTQPLLDGTPEPGEPSLPDQSEPHRIAKIFAPYLNGQVPDLDYEPVQVPTHILHAFLTQSSPDASLNEVAENHSVTDLKRKLEDDADDPVPGKRMRRYSCIQPLFPTDTIPVPSDVRNLLKSAGLRGPLQSTGEDQVGMPIATLRALAAQLAEAQRRSPQETTLELAEQAHLKKLDELHKTHEADYAKFEEAQRAHLRDRDHFESTARDLQKKLNIEAAQSLRRQEKDAAEIIQLAATVARLTAEGGDPLVQSENLVKEAQGKIKLLEKQIDQAKVDRGFAFEQYQAASSTAEELRDEVKKVSEANKDLQRRADANLVEIHRMNKDGIVKRLENLLSAEQIAKREMIQENHALREQIRQLKMVRRDTRHSSVPRSPRTGIMSPRPQRPAGPSSVSRGASPAPVMGSLADMYNGGNGAFSRTPGAQFTSTNNGAGDRS